MPVREEVVPSGALSAQRLALLARMLQQEGVSLQQKNAIARRANPLEFPLSAAQGRLCLLSLFEGGCHYNDHFHQRFSGVLDVPILEQALQEILRRHEVMRATFALENGEVVQRVTPVSIFHLRRLSLENVPDSDRLNQAMQLAVQDARAPFDLAQGPLWRFTLLSLAPEDHLLLITAHHICIDGWSRGVFLRELGVLYEALLMHRPSPLPELAVQYADYAAWHNEFLKTQSCLDQLEYWKRCLAGAPPVLEIPADWPRPSVQTFSGARRFLTLPAPLLSKLKTLCQDEGVTLFMCLLAAFQTLLKHYTGQEDVVVGSPVANRARSEAEALIGFFLNTLALRNDLSGDPTFKELLRRVRQTTLEALARQDVPIEQVFEVLAPDARHTGPRIQVLFILQNAPLPELKLPGCSLRAFEIDNGTAKFDLTLSLCESADGLTGWIQYSTDLFKAERIERLVTHWQLLLEKITCDPNQRLSQLTPLTAAESQSLAQERFRSYPNRSSQSQQSAGSGREGFHNEGVSSTPRDALESKLILIWQKVLGVSCVGLRDSFFDLGGHSLTALRLFAEVRKLTGKQLPLATLFEAPTVLQLANILRDSGWTPPWSSLVPIRPAGARLPFYCIHGGGGNVLLFRNLAKDLGPDYPFYALQARGLSGQGDYLTSVEEMAGAYLKEVRDFQPEGPYCLGGFCMGGQVAFHMAKLLAAANQKVNLLVLFDTYNHNGVHLTRTLAERLVYLGQKARFHWQNIAELSPRDRRIYLREKVREVRSREYDRLAVGIRNLVFPKRFHRHTGGKVFLENINDNAGFAYRPTPYAGQLTLIRPKRNYAFVTDPQMGWAGLAAGGLKEIELPINPGAMFNEPFVQILAQHLRACLDSCQASQS